MPSTSEESTPEESTPEESTPEESTPEESTPEESTPRHFARWQHEADLASLLEAVPDALVGVDRAGVIRYINHRAQSLFGYESNDLVGQPIETLVPDSVRPDHPAHREAYFAGPRTRRPADRQGTKEPEPAASPRCLHGRQSDGTEFPMNLSLFQFDTEDGLLVMAAVHDLTNRQEATTIAT